MKKFLKKKSVMITLLVCAVALLGLYIFLMARPVAYGLTYKHKETEDGATATSTIKIWSDKQCSQHMVSKDKNGKVVKENKVTEWIYRVDKYIVGVGTKEYKKVVETDALGVTTELTKDEIKEYNDHYAMSKDDYKDAIDRIYSRMNDKELEAGYEIGTVAKVNAFKMEVGGDTYVCAGQIVLTVVLGIVELALIAGATCSVVLFVKKK